MPLTLANMRTHARPLFLDTDTANQFLTNAELLVLFNRNLHWFLDVYSPRWTHEDSDTLGTVFLAGDKRHFLAPQTVVEVKQVFRIANAVLVTVTASGSSGSVTLTTAGSFSAVVVGMGVSHANIPARAYVKSIESSTSLTLSDKLTGAIAAETVGFRETTGKPLTNDDYARVVQLQDSESTPAAPLIYGLRRPAGATVDGVGVTELAVWPVPDATYSLPALVRYAATELAADADKPDVSDAESYYIAEMAAAMANRIKGDFERAEMLVRGLPEPMRAAFMVELRSVQPRTSQAVAGIA